MDITRSKTTSFNQIIILILQVNDLISSRMYNMIAPTDIDIYTLKADYEQNLKKGRLGIGAKVSYVKSGNDFQRYKCGHRLKAWIPCGAIISITKRM